MSSFQIGLIAYKDALGNYGKIIPIYKHIEDTTINEIKKQWTNDFAELLMEYINFKEGNKNDK